MRQEAQPWNKVTAVLEIVQLGSGSTGLTPTVAILRRSDNLWLQAGGGSWAAGFATNNMTEPSPANLPGLYQYSIPLGQLDHDAGLDGYILKIVESTTNLLEYVSVSTLRRSAWDDLRAGHSGVGSFGEGVVVNSIAADAVDAGALATSAIDEIADGVWEEILPGFHTGAGKAGQYLINTAFLPTKLEIADQVWDELAADHVNPLTMGGLQNFTGLSAGDVASAVWDALVVDYADPGTFGEAAGGGATPETIASAVWDKAVPTTPGGFAANSYGKALAVLRGLSQGYQRLVGSSYDPEGRLLQATLKVYATSADVDADTNVLGTFTIDATYDVDGNLALYLAR